MLVLRSGTVLQFRTGVEPEQATGIHYRRALSVVDHRPLSCFDEAMAGSTTGLLRFSCLNLRRNPLDELTTEQWMAFADVDTDSFAPETLCTIQRDSIQRSNGLWQGHASAGDLLHCRRVKRIEGQSQVRPDGKRFTVTLYLSGKGK